MACALGIEKLAHCVCLFFLQGTGPLFTGAPDLSVSPGTSSGAQAGIHPVERSLSLVHLYRAPIPVCPFFSSHPSPVYHDHHLALSSIDNPLTSSSFPLLLPFLTIVTPLKSYLFSPICGFRHSFRVLLHSFGFKSIHRQLHRRIDHLLLLYWD